MQRLGMTVPELQELHAALTRVIAAADPAAEPEPQTIKKEHSA
jgi:hypothetical protein